VNFLTLTVSCELPDSTRFFSLNNYGGCRKLETVPRAYLKGAELLGASPSKCIVFADSSPGFRSARAADMTCVGVGEIALSDEKDDAPDMAIRSFVGFDNTSVRDENQS